MHDDEGLDSFEKFRRDWPGGTMPAGIDGARRKAKRQTAKGRAAQKRVGQQTGGLRKRRRKGNRNEMGS